MRNLIKKIYYKMQYILGVPEYIWIYKIKKKWKL